MADLIDLSQPAIHGVFLMWTPDSFFDGEKVILMKFHNWRQVEENDRWWSWLHWCGGVFHSSGGRKKFSVEEELHRVAAVISAIVRRFPWGNYFYWYFSINCCKKGSGGRSGHRQRYFGRRVGRQYVWNGSIAKCTVHSDAHAGHTAEYEQDDWVR